MFTRKQLDGISDLAMSAMDSLNKMPMFTAGMYAERNKAILELGELIKAVGKEPARDDE